MIGIFDDTLFKRGASILHGKHHEAKKFKINLLFLYFEKLIFWFSLNLIIFMFGIFLPIKGDWICSTASPFSIFSNLIKKIIKSYKKKINGNK